MAQYAAPSAPDLTFSTAYIASRNYVVILSEVDDVATDGFVHTKILFYRDQNWSHHIVDWMAVKPWMQIRPQRELVVVGIDGEILQGSPTGFAEDKIDTSGDRPELVGQLRDLKQVGDALLTVGMARQAYLRKRGIWTRIDATMRAPAGDLRGFNGAAGLSEKEIYAAGLDGEIWRLDGTVWQPVTSPTNVTLHDVYIATDDNYYICGNEGVLLRGSGGMFDVIAQTEVEDNIFSIVEFRDSIYFATLVDIFRLRDGFVEPVDHGLGEGFTTGFLHAGDEIMWSVGAKHLVATEDGVSWAQVFVT